MCFSAQASFEAAAITACAGIYAVSRAPDRAFLPFAAIPLLFAGQQSLEGIIWVGLENVASEAVLNRLSRSFLIIGEAVWPLWIPLAVLLIEPDAARRCLVIVAAAIGAVMFAVFTLVILSAHYTPEIQNGCICYNGRLTSPLEGGYYPFAPGDGWRISGLEWMVLPYALTTLGALLVSSRLHVRTFGLVGAIGLVVSMLLYRQALVSVWCFFAAIASLVVVLAVQNARADPVRTATP